MSLKAKFGICKEPTCLTPGQQVLIVSGRCTPCRQRRFRGYHKPAKTKKAKPHKKTHELEFFEKLWADKSRPHVSFISGMKIEEFSVWSFAHLLPKGAYKRWRLNPDNIVYMLPQEHWQQHNLPKSKLIEMNPNWAKFFDLQDKLRQKYNQENK